MATTDGDGNLCWQAAFEQEIASLAVGIRSFPKEGLNAEKMLRDAYIAQLTRLGGQVYCILVYIRGGGQGQEDVFDPLLQQVLFLLEIWHSRLLRLAFRHPPHLPYRYHVVLRKLVPCLGVERTPPPRRIVFGFPDVVAFLLLLRPNYVWLVKHALLGRGGGARPYC